MLDVYKELTPVVYGEQAIKYLFGQNEKGDLCFNMHWHDRMEILLINSGCLEMHIGADEFKIYPGQLAVIGPQQMHCGIAGEEGATYHVIMFDIEKFMNGTPASDKYLVPILKNNVLKLPTLKSGFAP